MMQPGDLTKNGFRPMALRPQVSLGVPCFLRSFDTLSTF